MTVEEILKKMTKREIVAEYLKLMGARQVQPSRSRKYLQFETLKGTTYWLGRAGAVRRGRTVTGSVSVTDRVNTKKLAEIVSIGVKNDLG